MINFCNSGHERKCCLAIEIYLEVFRGDEHKCREHFRIWLKTHKA